MLSHLCVDCFHNVNCTRRRAVVILVATLQCICYRYLLSFLPPHRFRCRPVGHQMATCERICAGYRRLCKCTCTCAYVCVCVEVTCFTSLLLAAGANAAVRLNCIAYQALLTLLCTLSQNWGDGSIRSTDRGCRIIRAEFIPKAVC